MNETKVIIPQSFPDELKERVLDYLNKFQGAYILGCQSYDQQLYKDKSINTTYYKVYTCYGNLFRVFEQSICTRPEWSNQNDYSMMSAGEISFIVKNSAWFKQAAENN